MEMTDGTSFMDDVTALLEHHGVKGMHWGVRNAETLRRYANEKHAVARDYIANERHRKTNPDAKNVHAKRQKAKASRRKTAQVNYQRSQAIREDRIEANRNRALLSDAELNRRISRLQREQQLRRLTESEVTPVRSAVKEALNSVGKNTVSGTATHVVNTYTPLKVKNKK